MLDSAMESVLHSALGFSGFSADHFPSIASVARSVEQDNRACTEEICSGDYPQRHLVHAGVFASCQALYKAGGQFVVATEIARDLPVGLATDFEIQGWLEALANLCFATAMKCMPAELSELAQKWREDSAEQQAEILLRVFDILASDPPALNDETVDLEAVVSSDLTNQGPERIFPYQFLVERPDTEPNCLGKAQVLAAFLKKVGARFFGVTPLYSHYDFHEGLLIDGLERLEQWALEKGIRLADKFQRACERRRELKALQERSTSRFHMAVMVQLADGSWFYLDPHQRRQGPMICKRELLAATAAIDAYSAVLPGTALVISEMPSAWQTSIKAEDLMKELTAVIEKMLASWEHYEKRPEAAVPILASERLALEELAQYIERLELPNMGQEELIAAFRGERDDIPVLKVEIDGERTPRYPIRLQSNRTPSREEFLCYQLASFCLDILSKGAVSKARVESPEVCLAAFAEGFESCLGALVSLAYRKTSLVMGVGKNATEGVHPLVEVYEPTYRVGLELLSHLNAIGDTSEEVTMRLATSCSGQHQLLLAAAAPLRTGAEELSAASRGAAELLDSLPWILPEAEEVLDKLAERGLFSRSEKSIGGDSNGAIKETLERAEA